LKQANPRLIGAFVLGGVALAVTALVFLSSQDIFAKKRRFVMYFQQSVKGLHVGAPVQLRGIPIGEVIAIDGIYEPDRATITPRITIEVKPETLVNVELPDDPSEYPVLPALEDFGLRASLRSQSLLTGQLYVSLDFLPDKPVRKLGREVDAYPEMPTIDSGLDQTLAKLQDLPVEEALVQATDALAAIERMIEDPVIIEAIRDLDTLMKDADDMVIELRGVAALLNEQLGEDGGLDALVKGTDAMVIELRNVAGRLNERIAEDGALNQELLTALREISASARSVRELADELERRPESLLRGK
jgi:paraquat-inducible protein B